MAAHIRVLPDQLINQIAAGEVVERPASVVRELVDNAIDAGARGITVRLVAGGRSLISVSDDGCGMSKDDLLLAIQRHATSKIRNLSDLESLTTLGFRGEALPSISSVSRMRLSSRPHDAALGTTLELEGGVIAHVVQGPRPIGTDVEVRQLFFNTPARRKFLKSERNEELRIRSWIEGTALAHPEVHFRLVVEDREVLNFPPRGSAEERAKSIFSTATLHVAGVKADVAGQTYSLSGMLSEPANAVRDRNGLVLLVNGRQVSDRVLVRAVRDGYESMLKGDQYPVGYLCLQVPAQELDVNVHPQKAEVRFRNASLVYQLIFHAVRESVQGTRGFGSRFALPERSFTPVEAVCETVAEPRMLVFESASEPSPHTAQTQAFPSTEIQSGIRFQDLRFRAQVLHCYLICEYQNALVVVDMHAAHERVNYNRIRRDWQNKNIAVQQLLIPTSVTLGLEGAARIWELAEDLKSLGLEVEQFGDRSILVRAVPEILHPAEVEQLLRELAASELGALGSIYEQRIDAICARIACHASVRSGDNLSAPEVEALWKALDESMISGACPHGRPILKYFSLADVERWFCR